MRTRHKQPNLVSMWMLDVFCCALGCVTLLWLLSTREAKIEASRNASAVELLAKSEAELKARQAELLATKAEFEQTKRKLNADLEDLQGKYLLLTTERDDTAKQLVTATTTLSETQDRLAKSVAKSQELDDLLMRKQKDVKDLAAKLNTAAQSSDELNKLLRQKQRERDDIALKATKADEQLNDLDAKMKSLTKEAQDANSSLSAMRKANEELASAKATIIDLQGQKAKLADKFDHLKADTESRFAGIAMTGRQVVFIVDISGSMKLIDDKTPAPDKWPTVIETVAKVMRSIAELEKYQIIIFSRKAEHLIGSGEWQPYQGETSVKQVVAALKKVNPEGDTNMYEAFDLAFKARPSGLDTIYLFSDGLPTSGVGLTPEQERTASNTERTERLAKHMLTTLKTGWNRPSTTARVRINSIGFYFESPEVGAFLWALSRDNDGSFVGMSRP